MEDKLRSRNITIITLSILSLLSLGVIVIGTVKYKKMSKANSNFDSVIQNYINTLPVYANNADALANGLTVGQKYRTSSTATNYMVVVAAS